MKIGQAKGDVTRKSGGVKRQRAVSDLSSVASHACVGASKPLPMAQQRYSESPSQWLSVEGYQASVVARSKHSKLKSCKASFLGFAFGDQHDKTQATVERADASCQKKVLGDEPVGWGYYVTADDDFVQDFANLDLNDNKVESHNKNLSSKSHFVPAAVQQNEAEDEDRDDFDSDAGIFAFDEDLPDASGQTSHFSSYFLESDQIKKGGDISPDSVLLGGLRFFNTSRSDLSASIKGASGLKLDS